MIQLTALGTLIRLLKEDPVLANVRATRDDVSRLIRGYFRDGLSALEDANSARGEAEQQEFLRVAREYFRQASNREAGAASTRAMEYVALCFEVLGQPDDASRWLVETYKQVTDIHQRAVIDFNTPGSVLAGLRRDFAPRELWFFARAFTKRRKRVRPVPNDPRGRAFKEALLLELQARHLLVLLRERSVQCDPLPYMFVEDDEDALLVWSDSTQGGSMVFGTRKSSGEAVAWRLPPESIQPLTAIVAAHRLNDDT